MINSFIIYLIIQMESKERLSYIVFHARGKQEMQSHSLLILLASRFKARGDVKFFEMRSFMLLYDSSRLKCVC